MKKDTTRIKLSKEQKEEMAAAIQRYFLQERDEEIGTLASSLLLDFIIKELAPEFYNQGVSDSHQFMNERIEDLFSLQIYR